MGVSKSIAERLILTESAYFAGQSRIDGYKQTGVTHYKYVATLDSRTSDKCRHMDSKIIPINEAEPGVNYPPLHAYCRSTTIPHFDEAETQAEPDSDSDSSDYEDLYDVPEDMPYKEWAEEHAPADATDPPKPEDTAPVRPPKVTTAEPTLEKLTTDEASAVKRYIGESAPLNYKIHQGQPLGSKDMEWVQQLDQALVKLPRYRGDLTRSLHLTAPQLSNFMKQIKPGAVIQHPQYTSMTSGAALPDGQVQFHIIGAASGAHLAELSKDGAEVIYGRDFAFEVLDVELINGVYHILLRELVK